MIDKAVLLADLKGQVRTLEADLRQRAGQEPEFAGPLHREWVEAHEAGRTAATYETWLDGEVTQAAVAWVLGTVFLRFCEDNGLIDLPYLAGPSERLAVASERQQEFFEHNPHLTDRDWITAGFEDMGNASPVAAGLFDRAHNPMWRITPSHQAAKDLLAFWRSRDADGNVVHDFSDPGWDTRFLGDLYQDLSEHAKKTYALLQTPEFVEEFILDLTLDPAIDEFGLEPDPPRARPDLPRTLRVIDPACGSGHFLLGAFRRLTERWQAQHPTMDDWERIARVLSGLHGVDKNPFAVSIARFRLLLAVMKAGGVKRLADVHDFPLNIAVGDSLLHGRGGAGEQGELFGESGVFTYRNEDVGEYIKSADILGVNSYHVVVGNPPYITVKDRRENENYRAAYSKVCAGKYALSVPFARRFFDLATVAAADRRGAGYVGQITANSFMKREFGKKLIEGFFPTKELTHVIDNSGAYIPGHSTPTVILAGRNAMASTRPIRMALGVRGEPTQPEVPSKGKVWRAIVEQISDPGSDSEWITVANLTRDRLAAHPWSLSGGGADQLTEHVVRSSKTRLKTTIDGSVGFAGVPGMNEIYYVPQGYPERIGAVLAVRDLVDGKSVADWHVSTVDESFAPYEPGSERFIALEEVHKWLRHLWPLRTVAKSIKGFSGDRSAADAPWWCWQQWSVARHRANRLITYAFLSTHNEFAISSGEPAINHAAPVIKLPEHASKDEHLRLLGVLNSSTACFWLKQVCHDKGNGGYGGGIASEDWERFYELTGTKLEEFPLPAELPLEFVRALDRLAQQLGSLEPAALCADGVLTQGRLDAMALS